MEKGADDGSIWFNEHHGNKITRFDPINNALTNIGFQHRIDYVVTVLRADVIYVVVAG
jgi:hypothetical protein